MGFTSDLGTGLAEHLASNDIGEWDTTGVYATTDTGIVVGAMPPTPDRCIVITAYTSAEEYADQADTVVMVQARCRAGRHPDDVNDLADEIKDLIDGATYLTLNGVEIVQILWRSGAWLGRDANDRFERTDNYLINAMRPTAHRPV